MESFHESAEQAPQEPERKFVNPVIPENLETYEHKKIVQGYLAVGADGTEVRLRDKQGSYSITVKSAGTIVRDEHETTIDKAQFDALWGATAGKRLEKTRYNIPLGDHIVELDIYEGTLAGLVTAEVEFDTEADARMFTPPVWLGFEVTDSPEFKNQNLALYGLPQ